MIYSFVYYTVRSLIIRMYSDFKLRLVDFIRTSIIDVLLINLCYILAFLLRYQGHLPDYNFQAYRDSLLLLCFLTPVSFYLCGLYENEHTSWETELERTLKAVGLFLLFAVSATFMLRAFSFPRTVLLIATIMQLIVCSIWRRIRWVNRNRILKKKLIIIGTKDEILRTVKKSRMNTHNGISIVGYIASDTDNYRGNDIEFLGTLDGCDIFRILESYDGLVICSSIPYEKRYELVMKAMEYDRYVMMAPTPLDIIISTSSLSSIGDMPTLALKEEKTPSNHLVLKRLMDILISSLALFLLSPVMALVAIGIKLSSPSGSIFFKQERVGLGGKAFMLYKFRTMIPDAEKFTGPILATKDDNRVTTLGRFLRKARLDEIPQFINVLLGDMSLVGPRPERMYFIKQFASDIPEYNLRLKVPAGITGLAQVMGDYETNPRDKLAYDLAYAKSWNVFKDFEIMFRTAGVMARQDKGQ